MAFPALAYPTTVLTRVTSVVVKTRSGRVPAITGMASPDLVQRKSRAAPCSKLETVLYYK